MQTPGDHYGSAMVAGRRWKKQPKAADEAAKVSPNRAILRRNKIGIVHRMGTPHARLTSSRRLTPPEIDTHVTLVQLDENGKWLTRVTVPRSMVRGIRQEPIFPRKG